MAENQGVSVGCKPTYRAYFTSFIASDGAHLVNIVDMQNQVERTVGCNFTKSPCCSHENAHTNSGAM